ncbi:GPP34 family phosphoprotein [Streptomyces sp. NPDC023723]|uniref:GOLPH3/VPS74 family protein n=1 Tax=Streptomyces sp. NPDC023723 TaxID=3154323 RepID=UPI0033FEBD26
MPHGPLSVPARLCLLAGDTAPAHRLVRAGALAELARRGLLVDDDGIATPVDLDSRTGDPVLDGLLDLVRESLPHDWRTWVRLRARITWDAVREQLVAERCLRAEKRRVLGVFPSVSYALARPALVDALRDRTRQVLRGPAPAAEVPVPDAAVAVLAAAARLRGLGPPADGVRSEALSARGAGAPGVRRIMRELCAAVGAATAGAPAPTAG